MLFVHYCCVWYGSCYLDAGQGSIQIKADVILSFRIDNMKYNLQLNVYLNSFNG